MTPLQTAVFFYSLNVLLKFCPQLWFDEIISRHINCNTPKNVNNAAIG